MKAPTVDQVELLLDEDGQGAEYKRLLGEVKRDDAAQASGITLATMLGGTVDGRTVVLVTFAVKRGGETFRVQATTTQKLLLGALKCLEGAELRRKN